MATATIRTCFVLLSAVFFYESAAQKKYAVTGIVKDSTGKALQYATASLYKTGSPEAVATSYTSDKGAFRLSGADTGSYTLSISHTGYAELEKNIRITGADTDAGILELRVFTGTLSGVVVTAKKPLIEQTDDKIIYNAENDPASKTETAIDILRKTPFVSVDGENNVMVNGQSNFRVLLNGRETSMFAQNVKEALKGFPGALIVKIEVITSPSAKYDAEGVGGIINIITKKKVVGYNGSVSLYATTNRFTNVNANFSAKFGRLGMTLFYGGNGNNNLPGRSTTATTPYIPTIFTHRLLEGERRFSNFWQFGNMEVNYEIDTLNIVSAYMNMNGGFNKTKLNQTITTTYPSAPATTSYYDISSRNEYPNKSVGTDYIRKFASNKEKEFSIRLNGEFGNSNTFSNSEQDNPGTDRYIQNTSIAKNRQYTIQSDFIQPLTKSRKIEAGVKAILRRASSDFESLEKYTSGENYKPNPANTDYFNYDQDVYSIYSTYSFKVKKTTFRLGARLEHTLVDGNFVSSETKVGQKYTNILPNLQASIRLNNTYTLVTTYSIRMQRPFIWNLNPFVNNNDSLFISYGNPALDPQTIHALSAQVRIMKGNTFAGITLTGSYSDDMIVQYASFDAATGVTSTTSGNIGKETQVMMNLNLTTRITPDWSVFLNGRVAYNHVRNSSLKTQTNSGFGGNANLNTTYTISKRFNISGYAGFFRQPVAIQYSFPLNTWYGINFGYKLFNEKLTIAGGLSNFLKKEMDFRVRVIDPNFRTITTSTFPYRGLALSLSWNFGKMTENVSKKKGVTNDDLIGNGQGGGN
ncbi:MAG TPA: TonB-dependent receptor [Chitinophagaceae bacterium]|nr:TonB-dependent receptor [Chitinophagaceae bacterium]